MMQEFYEIRLKAIWAGFKEAGFAFWLICFYLLLEYVRPQSLYPQIDVIPYAQVTLVMAIIALFLKSKKGFVKNPENVLMHLFLVVILLSSVSAYYPRLAFDNIEFFLIWYIVYFLIINIVDTEKKFFIFLFLFLLFNFKMSQHGFRSWASIGFQFRNWGVTGAPGWFHNSGEFGIEMCVFLPISLYFLFALRKYWGKVKLAFFALFPFTALASIVATTSRGAIVGAAAALIWMLLSGKQRIKGLVGLVIIGFASLAFMPEEFSARFKTAGSDGTSVSRTERWKYGFEMMNEHPLLGIGYYNWTRYYRENYTPAGGWGLPHNMFIDAGSELGYTGLIVYLLMNVYVLVNNRRTRQIAQARDKPFLLAMARGMDAALVGLAVSGSFVSVLYYPYFWVLMPMVVALNNIATNVPASEGADDADKDNRKTIRRTPNRRLGRRRNG